MGGCAAGAQAGRLRAGALLHCGARRRRALRGPRMLRCPLAVRAPTPAPVSPPAPLPQVARIKASHDGRLEDYRGSAAAVYVPGRRAWEVEARLDAAFPCATQVGCGWLGGWVAADQHVGAGEPGAWAGACGPAAPPARPATGQQRGLRCFLPGRSTSWTWTTPGS